MDGMQQLVARRVEKVLESLNGLVARARTGEEVPSFTLTLHLANGQQLAGTLVDYQPREALVLATGREGLMREESVTYVDLASVVAVSVSGAAALTQVPFLVRPIPSRDELLKLAEQLASRLTQQFWPSEAELLGKPLRFEVDWVKLDTEPGRRALEGALHSTAHALRLIGRGRNGRDTLRRFARILFLHGSETAASLEGDTGRITVEPGAPTPPPLALRKGLASGL